MPSKQRPRRWTPEQLRELKSIKAELAKLHAGDEIRTAVARHLMERTATVAVDALPFIRLGEPSI